MHWMIMQLLVISAMCDYKSFSHALASCNDDINLMAEGWTDWLRNFVNVL